MSALDDLIRAVEAGDLANDWRFVTKAIGLNPDSRHILLWETYIRDDMNAALSLFEALLPDGWRWMVTGNLASVSRVTSSHMMEDAVESTSPARALLIAVLKAHRDTRKGDEE